MSNLGVAVMKSCALRAGRLHTIAAWAIGVLLSSISGFATAATVAAFGQDLAFPSTSTTGTILARSSVTPQQLCGATTCPVAQVTIWVQGGSYSTTGPLAATGVGGVSVQFLINGVPMTSGNLPSPITLSQPVEVQLVRAAGTLYAGDLALATGTFLNVCPVITAGWSQCYSYQQSARITLAGKITSIAGTCQTPDQTVNLPAVLSRSFTSVGSTTGETGFDIRLNNCPAGYNRVGYSLNPVGGVIENAPGVLPLLAASTAVGVGIRLADDSGTPVVFNSSVEATVYNKATGGSYSIPMKASYFQTGASVTAGTVNGAATVLLDYQ